MLNKIRGSIFPALAFAALCYIFGQTEAIRVLEPADVDVGDEGDMCQCGPRCAGYVEEHSCARCCTSVMRRRRRSTINFFNNYAFGRGSTSSSSSSSKGVQHGHAHRQREHPNPKPKLSRKHHNHNQIIHQNQQQQQQKPYSRGTRLPYMSWRCALFKICPAENHLWHLALAFRLRTHIGQGNSVAQIDKNPME